MPPDGTMFGLLTVNASRAGIDHVLWMVKPEKNPAVSVPAWPGDRMAGGPHHGGRAGPVSVIARASPNRWSGR